MHYCTVNGTEQVNVVLHYLLYHCVVKLLLHNPLFLSIHYHQMKQHGSLVPNNAEKVCVAGRGANNTKGTKSLVCMYPP